MKKLLLIAGAICMAVLYSYAQDYGPFPGLKKIAIAPDVNATIVENYQSSSKDAVYYPSDSPDPTTWNWNTYTELGWTEIEVTETDLIGVVTIEYTWETTGAYWMSHFHIESPIGTEKVFAAGNVNGTYSVSLTDFFGETMNGTWILWIENEHADWNGHQATDITVTFHAQLSHDIGVCDIAPDYISLVDITELQVEVYNFGTNDETSYSVNLTDGGAYNETINITNPISSNTSALLNFPSWSPAEDINTLTATVSLSGDENPDNNTFASTCYVGPGEYQTENVYSYIPFADGNMFQIVMLPFDTGIENPIANPMVGYPISAGEYMNGEIYATQFRTNDVFVVTAEGNAIKVGTLSGITPGMSAWDFAYDQVNDVLYTCATYDYNSITNFYTVDNSWNCSLIGSADKMFLGLTTDSIGDLYGLEIHTNNFCSINKTNGSYSVIGNIGFNAAGWQNLGIDRFNDIIYAVLTLDGIWTSKFGTIDKQSGLFTAINDNLVGMFSMCAVVHEEIVSIDDISGDINIYPNPTFGVFNINSDCTGAYLIEITDINGKLILFKGNCKDQTQIDLSKYAKGVYIVKVMQNNEIITGKIILK